MQDLLGFIFIVRSFPLGQKHFTIFCFELWPFCCESVSDLSTINDSTLKMSLRSVDSSIYLLRFVCPACLYSSARLRNSDSCFWCLRLPLHHGDQLRSLGFAVSAVGFYLAALYFPFLAFVKRGRSSVVLVRKVRVCSRLCRGPRRRSGRM